MTGRPPHSIKVTAPGEDFLGTSEGQRKEGRLDWAWGVVLRFLRQ